MAKFKESKQPGLLGITHVWTELLPTGVPDKDSPFQVLADEGGIRLMGNSRRMVTQQDLESLAQTIGAAGHAFKQCQKKVTNAAGH